MNQLPSIGRIVHYVSYGSPMFSDGTQAYRSECRAAVITAVVGKAVKPPAMEDAHDGGTWHWPERVE